MDDYPANVAAQHGSLTAKTSKFTKASTGDTTCSFTGVELVKAGTWQASTGTVEVTRADIAACIAAAHELPDPVIKLGHNDPRFTGNPALGRVTNLRSTNRGTTLIGDFEGMPQWLANAAPTHFSQRSIEATSNLVTNGKVYPFALTGVALLGASWPAVTDLESLQDLLERTAA